MGAVWASFGGVIAVAHTLYAPREWSYGTGGEFFCYRLVLEWETSLPLVILLPLTLGFMLWVVPHRRGSAIVIWIASVALAVVQLCAAYAFHPTMLEACGMRNGCEYHPLLALTNANVYKQTLMIINAGLLFAMIIRVCL